MMQHFGKKHSLNYERARKCNVLLSMSLAQVILCLAVFLRLKRAVSPTIALGVDLSIGLSILTLCITGLRFYLSRSPLQSQGSGSQDNVSTTSPRKARLETACRRGIKVLLWLWTALSGWNMVIAIRAPICGDGPRTLVKVKGFLLDTSWKFGTPCRVHRAIVSFSVILLTCLLLVYFITYCRSSRDSLPRRRMLPYDKEDQLYLFSEGRSNRLDREQWLQRRNSISSQRAIFPYKVDSHPFEHRPRYAMYNHAPSSRYSSTLRSVSEGACLDLSSDRSSSLNSTQSSGSFARSGRISTTFHSIRARATSNTERPVTARPDKDSSGKDAIPDVPPLPAAPAPTWSPALNHTPLSADPSIRAWTNESEGGQRASVLYSRSSSALISQLPPRSRFMEPKIRKRSQGSTKETMENENSRTVTQNALTSTLTTTSPHTNTSPPGPPPTLNLPVLPTARTGASNPPAIPLRAPGHSISRATTPHDPATPSAAPSLRPALRRPSPLRYRQHPSSHSHQQHPQHYHYTPQQHYQKYQSELALQAGMGTTQLSARHSRTYRRQDHRRGRDPVSSSIYSTSSYGTSRTMPSAAANVLALAR